MKVFECPHCGQMLFFENVHCERCGHRLGYIDSLNLLTAFEEAKDAWVSLEDGGRYRPCANREHEACNWMLPLEGEDTLCTACGLNRIIPDLTVEEHLLQWRTIEVAKHRLVYTLRELELSLRSKMEDAEEGLCFDFLADEGGANSVLTGHADGVITLNIREADPAFREQTRASMHEPYRTLLGHFRHEIGHYYWDRLVKPREGVLREFRGVFGDEREDYGQALQRYYAEGPAADWREHCVSAYATAHPWEDWAETWAHYLHVLDTLETAHSFGIRIQPRAGDAGMLALKKPVHPFRHETVESLIEAWLPVTFAVNSLNRSMGQPDLYPFVLPAAAMEKLGFIHRLVRAWREGAAAPAEKEAMP